MAKTASIPSVHAVNLRDSNKFCFFFCRSVIVTVILKCFKDVTKCICILV